tara:strand:+ start:27753 stop:28652 length:900 start_codon:yes stop_codon:yes gene_type:complete
MNNSDNDQINLGPYFKLFYKLYSASVNWLIKKVWYIIGFFVVLMTISFVYDRYKSKQNKFSGYIEVTHVSLDKIKIILSSLEEQIAGEALSSDFEKFLNKKGIETKINSLKYDIDLSFKDSIRLSYFSNDNVEVEKLDYDYPIRIELRSNSVIDSIENYFVEFLNTNSRIKEIRDLSLSMKQKEVESINEEIRIIDSLIFLSTEKDKNKRAEFEIESNKDYIYQLFELKHELIMQKLPLENHLENLRESEVTVLGKFSQTEDGSSFKPTNYRFLLKYIFLSFIITLIIDFLVKGIRYRK